MKLNAKVLILNNKQTKIDKFDMREGIIDHVYRLIILT